ncbi:TetR/AcrR family transcriptional regulator [Inquilinus limosus]|uniref:TetR/AcrR family transcriptional regulator n=1 Tax=Inquilinus limosus TaxID=171674 RepID=UPI0004168D4C|nr:TetR/AcrR family transcriptional regulator [Inquilinus limosus]
MPRLNRSESQAQTRERLLESARRAFLSDGYVRARVDRIAEEAGYSKGAVYSNFDGKEALFLELLRRKFATELDGLRQLLDRFPEPDGLLAALRAHYEQNQDVLDFTTVSAEFLTQVGRGSAFAAEHAALYAGQRRALGELLTALFERSGLRLPVPSEELAAALVGMTLGLAVQRGADPASATPALWGRAIELFLKGLLGLAAADRERPQPLR